MPRYFFDVTSAGHSVVDDIGEDLPDPNAALEVALALLDCIEWQKGSMRLDTTVRTQTGDTLLVATMQKSFTMYQAALDDAGAEPVTNPMILGSTAGWYDQTRETAALLSRSYAMAQENAQSREELAQSMAVSTDLLSNLRKLIGLLKAPSLP